jgi:hypothetical protein
MKRALIAATAYFLALFALGFVLGTIRVLFIVPAVGLLVATLLEVPVMLIAAFFLCRWAIRHWQVGHGIVLRGAMGLCFLTLLVAFEAVLGVALFGRTLAEQLVALASAAGLIGLSAQLIAAILPMAIGRGEQMRAD